MAELLQQYVERSPVLEGKRHVGDGLAVAQLHAAHQQVAHVEGAAPHLGHTAVHVAQGVNRLHASAHGVLGGEDGVARRLGELAEESEVHGAVGHHIGTVAQGTRHEERSDVGHHHGNGVRVAVRQLLDLGLRYAQVPEPFLADLLTRALRHGLLHVVALVVGEEAVHPHTQLVARLVAELLLTVDGPAHEPTGVAAGHNAARHRVAAERVALADLLDVGRDGIVERGDGGAHPLGLLRVGAEDVGVAEAGVLAGDATPQVPAVARLSLREPRRGLGLRADGSALDATAVGDEHEVVLSEVDDRLLAVRAGHDAGGDLLYHRAVGIALEMRLLDALDGVLPGAGHGALGSSAAADGKADVLHLRVEVELHARLLKVGHHGQNHGLVLVVACEAQRGEVRQAGDMVDVALDVQLHLEGGMPVLKGEHGAPVHPEVGVQHLVVEEVGDGLVVEVLVRREEEPHDLHRRLVRQAELAVGVGILAALLGGSAQREVGVFLVEPVVLVEHRDAGILD